MGGPASAEVKKLDAAASASAEEVGQKLYAKRIKIYPKKITGQFQTWRWALVWLTQILYYGLPWVNWHDRQAVLFHLAERKFYIFGIVLWPQDFIYLTGLLVISALALFLFTAVAGRLWCGYACPQTVYTEIFVWIEQLIEGDRPKQMKFDQGPMSARKLALKALKFGAWGLFALWTGFTFVGYFTPIRELWFEVLTLAVAGWSLFWMLFYAGFTVLQAGFMREQVCKYMCPYARFQSAMFDKDTLIVTYDTKRGEPRGARSKKVDFKAQGMGACVDCGVCVQVCPTGIDIRHGLQYECIGCGACADACDQIMDKMGYDRGLVRYTTENALEQQYDKHTVLSHVMRPRTLIYTAILSAIVIAWIAAIAMRNPLKVDVIRDRGSLWRELDEGVIENVYRVQFMNTEEQARDYRITIKGLDGAKIASEPVVHLAPTATTSVPVRIQAPPGVGTQGANKIEFAVESVGGAHNEVVEKAIFFVP